MDQQWNGPLYASTAEISDTCIFHGMVITLERTNDLTAFDATSHIIDTDEIKIFCFFFLTIMLANRR